MTFGAPSHRLESQLNATAAALHIDAQFVHLPSIVIASFGDTDVCSSVDLCVTLLTTRQTRTSETHFVKAGGGLDLGNLHRVHEVYREVLHEEITVIEGSTELSRLLKAKPIYNTWMRVLIAAGCAGVICLLGSVVLSSLRKIAHTTVQIWRQLDRRCGRSRFWRDSLVPAAACRIEERHVL